MSNVSDSPVFDPKQTVGAAVARATFDVAIQAAIKVAQGYVPILAVTPLKQLFEFTVTKFFDILYIQSEQGASALIIDIKVDREDKAYKEAVASLKDALQTKSIEEIAIEKQKFKDRLRALISLKP